MWKNDHLDQLQLDLLKQNILVIGGEIDWNAARYVREALLRCVAKGSPDIRVLITCEGGDLHIGLNIYDLLKSYEGYKTALVQGYAQSIAAVILQACEKRQSLPHSYIRIHHMHDKSGISLDILRDAEKLKAVCEDMEQCQAQLDRILTERTGKSIDEIRATCEKDEDMNAEEARDFGLIDEIVFSLNTAKS